MQRQTCFLTQRDHVQSSQTLGGVDVEGPAAFVLSILAAVSDDVSRRHGLRLPLFPEPRALPLLNGGLQVRGGHVHGGPDADGVRVQVDVLASFRAASDLVVDPVHRERQEQFRFLSFIPPPPPPHDKIGNKIDS